MPTELVAYKNRCKMFWHQRCKLLVQHTEYTPNTYFYVYQGGAKTARQFHTDVYKKWPSEQSVHGREPLIKWQQSTARVGFSIDAFAWLNFSNRKGRLNVWFFSSRACVTYSLYTSLMLTTSGEEFFLKIALDLNARNVRLTKMACGLNHHVHDRFIDTPSD